MEGHPLIGIWRIVEADQWDRASLDLCGPATLRIAARGVGEVAFGALEASLDVDYGPDEVGFKWVGADETDEVSGSGSAELQDDGTLVIAFEYDSRDEAVLTAVRQPEREEPPQRR